MLLSCQPEQREIHCRIRMIASLLSPIVSPFFLMSVLSTAFFFFLLYHSLFLLTNDDCFFFPFYIIQDEDTAVGVDDREELDFMFDEELDNLNVGKTNNFTEW